MSLMDNGVNDGKEIIGAGSEQVSFQLDIVKKKLKIYGIQKKTEIEMAKLGEIVYNFFQRNDKDILNNKQIIDMVESIKEEKEEIKKAEQEIADIQSNLNEAKKKLYFTGKNLFDKIKKSWNPEDKAIEKSDAGQLEQTKTNIEKDAETGGKDVGRER